jgi:hypothetical protein
MKTTVRFSVDHDGYIIDHVNPCNSRKARGEYGASEDEGDLRERILWRSIFQLLDELTEPIEPKLRNQNTTVRYSMVSAIFAAICASHLNTLAVGLSVKHRFSGELKRKKRGWQDGTSLSLFGDGVERLLRDLYGESDNRAVEKLRYAVIEMATEFARYLYNDLWQEHTNAKDIDYACGIGVPEGCAIHGSDCSAANAACNEIAVRARDVRANPSAYSKYTIEFVDELYEHSPGFIQEHDCSADQNRPPLAGFAVPIFVRDESVETTEG